MKQKHKTILALCATVLGLCLTTFATAAPGSQQMAPSWQLKNLEDRP